MMLEVLRSLFHRKADNKTVRPDLPWVIASAEKEFGLTRLDWDAVHKQAAELRMDQDEHALWGDIAHQWLIALNDDLGGCYAISESENFMLLSSEQSNYNNALLRYLEQCRRRLLFYLNGIASDEGFGPYVVIAFEDNDPYYDYVCFFGPKEGTFGMSSGSFISHGYGHFVFPHQELSAAEPVVAHEMTHALVSHLPIPLWLNEGLAVNMEATLSGYSQSQLTREFYEKHHKFWDSSKIQQFWSGESFSRADDGQSLSYQLARILVSNLAKQTEEFVSFCNHASWEDAGENALQNFYGLSLSDMLFNFLGEGQWQPNPSLWSS